MKERMRNLLCERLADLADKCIVVTFFKDGGLFRIVSIVFTFDGVDAHHSTEVFRLRCDRDQIHGDSLKESEDGASLSLLQHLVVGRVLVRVVL